MNGVLQTIEGLHGIFVHGDRQTIGFTPFTKTVF